MTTTNPARTESLPDELATVIHEGTKLGQSSHDIAVKCLGAIAMSLNDDRLREIATRAVDDRLKELQQETESRLKA